MRIEPQRNPRGWRRSWENPACCLHSSSPGYMGVLVGDVDSDTATKFKLKDTHGAVITLIDHDAPAAQAGIHVNDVVLQVNGQAWKAPNNSRAAARRFRRAAR